MGASGEKILISSSPLPSPLGAFLRAAGRALSRSPPASPLPQCEEDGQVFFSLDDGATKFTDLIQLVEFYQLNRGVLPCKLKHPCTAVAL